MDATAQSASGARGPGWRCPLSFVGLALAGANKPVKAGQGDGILTGEPIPRLLQWLRLAILDACETGEGQVTGGEGMQGMQCAFQLAGCPNVVATLWRTSKMAACKLARGNATSICGKTSSQHWKPCARPSLPCTRTPAACRFRLRGAESRSSLPATLLPICYRTVTANANEVTRSCGELPSFIPGLDIHSWTRRNWPPRCAALPADETAPVQPTSVNRAKPAAAPLLRWLAAALALLTILVAFGILFVWLCRGL